MSYFKLGTEPYMTPELYMTLNIGEVKADAKVWNNIIIHHIYIILLWVLFNLLLLLLINL